MPTVRECRRLRLLELVAANGGDRGGQAAVARIANKSPKQISAWATGIKKISDRSADQIAAAFHKPSGWMDRLTTSSSETPGEPGGQSGLPSQSVKWDSESLTEAERWVRFEEGAGAKYTPEQRSKRFAALYDATLAGGGRLPREHCDRVIKAARERLKQGGENDGDDDDDKGGGPKER